MRSELKIEARKEGRNATHLYPNVGGSDCGNFDFGWTHFLRRYGMASGRMSRVYAGTNSAFAGKFLSAKGECGMSSKKWFKNADGTVMCKGADCLIRRHGAGAKWNCDWAKIKKVISENEAVVVMNDTKEERTVRTSQVRSTF